MQTNVSVVMVKRKKFRNRTWTYTTIIRWNEKRNKFRIWKRD